MEIRSQNALEWIASPAMRPGPKPGNTTAWGGRNMLRRNELAAIMPLFGFHNVDEFTTFIEEQAAKVDS